MRGCRRDSDQWHGCVRAHHSAPRDHSVKVSTDYQTRASNQRVRPVITAAVVALKAIANFFSAFNSRFSTCIGRCATKFLYYAHTHSSVRTRAINSATHTTTEKSYRSIRAGRVRRQCRNRPHPPLPQQQLCTHTFDRRVFRFIYFLNPLFYVAS